MIKSHSTEETFVKTHVVDKALICVIKKGIVILIGVPGIGKSRVGLEIIQQFSMKGERCIKLDKIEQWQEMSEGMDAVFIDDVFGRTKTTYDENIHSKLLDMIYSTIQNKNVKVMFTLRKDIFHTIKITDHHRIFLDQYALDLSSDKNQMTVKEKESCLMKYFKKNNILVTDDIAKVNISADSAVDTDSTVYLHKDTLQKILHSDTETQIGFPEKCCLFASDRKFTRQGCNFFCHPTEQLVNEIDNFRSDGKTNMNCMIDFTFLVYALLKGVFVNVHEIDLNAFRSIIKTIYRNSQVEILKMDIHDSARRLLGKYLKMNNDGNYCFQNRLIREAVLISYSVADSGRAIPLLEFDFIIDMTRPQFYQSGEGEVIFSTPTSCYSLLARRLLHLLEIDNRPYQFVQNLCKSKIITMTSNNILRKIIKHYNYKIPHNVAENLWDHRFSGKSPYYAISTLSFYLPSALIIFCDTDFVNQCLYNNIHKTLTFESHSLVIVACKKTLLESFKFSVCTMDLKRSNVILKILINHSIKQDTPQFYFCNNIMRCQGLPGVQFLLTLHGLSQVFNLTSLLSWIFKTFIVQEINIDADMKKFITSVILNNKHDKLPVSDIVEFVFCKGELDFVKDVYGRFESSLFDIDYMVVKACKGRKSDVIQWLGDTYRGLYNVQLVLNESCLSGCMEGVQIILKMSDHTVLDMNTIINKTLQSRNNELFKMLCVEYHSNIDMKEAMNEACSSRRHIEIVKWLFEKFDNNLFDMKTAMNKACGEGNIELVTWLCGKFDNNLFHMKTAMNEACKYGRTELVKWLLEKFDSDLFDIKTLIKECRKNTELVKWLDERFGDSNIWK